MKLELNLKNVKELETSKQICKAYNVQLLDVWPIYIGYNQSPIKGTPLVFNFGDKDYKPAFRVLKHYGEWVALDNDLESKVEAPLISVATSKVQKEFLGEFDFKRARNKKIICVNCDREYDYEKGNNNTTKKYCSNCYIFVKVKMIGRVK